MDCGFQVDAFQNNAFQVCVPVIQTGGRNLPRRVIYQEPPLQDDDDLLLAAWLMFMTQPYKDKE